jgi:hypothetical protein
MQNQEDRVPSFLFCLYVTYNVSAPTANHATFDVDSFGETGDCCNAVNGYGSYEGATVRTSSGIIFVFNKRIFFVLERRVLKQPLRKRQKIMRRN